MSCKCSFSTDVVNGTTMIDGKKVDLYNLSLDEFSTILCCKEITHKDVTWEKWLKDNKFEQDVMSDYEMADYVGRSIFGVAGGQTRRTKGIVHGLRRKYERSLELRERYANEVKDVHQMVPVDKENETDLAYIRLKHKRLIRSALKQGIPVNQEVKDYYQLD